jgi:hypothetical protein
MKLPKGLKLSCARHGSDLKYHDGDHEWTNDKEIKVNFGT